MYKLARWRRGQGAARAADGLGRDPAAGDGGGGAPEERLGRRRPTSGAARRSRSSRATAWPSRAGTRCIRPTRRGARTSRRASTATKGPVIAATDYMRLFAEQIRPLVHRRYVVLGTDGFGRSDTRENLRHFFEVNPQYIAVAALKALADDGAIPVAKVSEAIAKYGLDPDKPAPGQSDEACMARVKVPDIGDFKDIPVIEVLVKAGDTVKAEDALVTLESDKATMDVPAPVAGVVKEVKLKAGDKVSEGSARAGAASRCGRRRQAAAATGAARGARCCAARRKPTARAHSSARAAAMPRPRRRSTHASFTAAHASPSVRKFARELGVDVSQGERHRAERAHHARRRAGVRERRDERPAGATAPAAGRSTCCRGRRSISRSTGRSKPCRCRASGRSPARTSRATG